MQRLLQLPSAWCAHFCAKAPIDRHFLQRTVSRSLTVLLARILNDGRFAYKNNIQRPLSLGEERRRYRRFPGWQTDPGSVHKPAVKQAPFQEGRLQMIRDEFPVCPVQIHSFKIYLENLLVFNPLTNSRVFIIFSALVQLKLAQGRRQLQP